MIELEQRPETFEYGDFTSRQRELLESDGYLIYRLTGKTCRDHIQEGRLLNLGYHVKDTELELLQSRVGEVAIPADYEKFFLNRVGFLTLLYHRRDFLGKINSLNRMIGYRYLGAEFALGEFPDYVELTFLHLDNTGEKLFRMDETYTNTERSKSFFVVVGPFGNRGLSVRGRSDGNETSLAAPIIVPNNS